MKVPALLVFLTLLGVATAPQDAPAAPEPLPVTVQRLEKALASATATQTELKQRLDLLAAGDQKIRDLEAKVKILEDSLAAVRDELEQARNQPRDSVLVSRMTGARAGIKYGSGYGLFLGDTEGDLPGIELGLENGSPSLRMRAASRHDLVRLGGGEGVDQPALEIFRSAATGVGRRSVRLGPMPTGGGLVLYSDDGTPLVQLGTDGSRRCYLVLGRGEHSLVLTVDGDNSSIRVDGRDLKVR